MKTIQEIKTEFEEILSDVSRISGITPESAVQVATAILHESGKFQRTQILRDINQNNRNRNGNQPATDKQKNALRKFGIQFSDDITKAEASQLIEYAIEHANSNAKGRGNPASSSY